MNEFSPRVFVLGKEKSGTTAVAALLARASGLTAQLDMPALWGNCERALASGELSFAEFVQNHPQYFKAGVIKEPGLSLYAADIRDVFPRARVFSIVRDPRQNTRSVLNRIGLPGDLTRLSWWHRMKIPEHWDVVLEGEWLGLPGRHYIETLAHRWNLFAAATEAPESDFVVRYEDFLVDRAGFIERLTDRLGLQVRSDVGSDVTNQYQSRGDSTMSPHDFFGPNLRRIEIVCRDAMARHGYSVST